MASPSSAQPPAAGPPQQGQAAQIVSDIPRAQPGPSLPPVPPGTNVNGLPSRSVSSPSFGVLRPAAGPTLAPAPPASTRSPAVSSSYPSNTNHGRPAATPGSHWSPPVNHQAAMSKPMIMDPPRPRATPPAHPTSTGYPSPDIDHTQAGARFGEDCARIAQAVQSSSHEAVRRVIRDNWEKCLLGSDFHQAFIMNATIHHASPTIFQRAIRDFGGEMVRKSKVEILHHLASSDLDEVADLILAKVGEKFLDKALNVRLRTIEAKPLINALARAERLGYEPSDVVEDNHQQEAVIGNPQEQAAPLVSANVYAPAPPHQSQPAPSPASPYQCHLCRRTFAHPNAFDFHTRNKVCAKTPTSINGFKGSCPHCGQGFTTVVGMQYHFKNKVCGDHGDMTAGATPSSPINLASGNSSPNPYASQPPPVTPAQPASGWRAYNAPSSSNPAPSSTQSARVTASPAAGTPSGSHDPYAHLSKEALASMQEELRQAEITYGERMRAAKEIPDDAERETRLSALSNSFGTKQSLIRKKYGVRLRQRRTRAEIEAEKARMATAKEARIQNGAAIGVARVHQSRDAASSLNGKREYSPHDSMRIVDQLVQGAPGSNAGSHDAKRQRVDEDGSRAANNNSAYAVDDSPLRKKVAVADMGGGLAGSQATAEDQDPTQPPGSGSAVTPPSARPYPGVGTSAHAIGSRPGSSNSDVHTLSRAASVSATARQAIAAMAMEGNLSSDTDDDEDDDGIPPTLPPGVRKTLTATPPRPQSSASGH